RHWPGWPISMGEMTPTDHLPAHPPVTTTHYGMGVSYLPTILLLAFGLVLLVLVLVRTWRSVSRFNTMAKLVGGHAQDEKGLLTARTAAVKLALAQRREQGWGVEPDDPRRIESDPTQEDHRVY